MVPPPVKLAVGDGFSVIVPVPETVPVHWFAPLTLTKVYVPAVEAGKVNGLFGTFKLIGAPPFME